MTITLDGNNANTVGVINSATAKNATGTAVDFTGIPAGVKRITVMFNGVSTNGTSLKQIQIGSGSVTSSGYSQCYGYIGASQTASNSATSGFVIGSNVAADVLSGLIVLSLVSSNVWCCAGNVGNTTGTAYYYFSSGSITLSGTLDRIRITTVNGTDTFDAGSINILYE